MIQERLRLGPIDLSLPGSMELHLGMVGDRVRESEAKFGFSKRFIEEDAVGRHFRFAQLRFGRIDPENGMILDRLFSEAVEAATHTPVEARAHWIREISTSISELNGFLRYLSRRFGLDVLTHIILKHREALLDLIELLTGSRYGYAYIVPGGVRYDLTEGFQERLEKWIKSFSRDFERIRAFFLWTHSFHNRLRSIGRVVDGGSFGFVSESSVETTRYGLVSHVESRLVYALERSFDLCEELGKILLESASGGRLSEIRDGKKEDSRSQVDIETARGSWSLELSLNSSRQVTEIKTRFPSDLIVDAISPALEGECFEDIAIILESLYFSTSEFDR